VSLTDIQFEEKKVQKAIKEAAKRSDMNTCKVQSWPAGPGGAGRSRPEEEWALGRQCEGQTKLKVPSGSAMPYRCSGQELLARVAHASPARCRATSPHLHPACVQVLAREIVQSRKAVGRLYVNKAQMMCVGNALSEQLGAKNAPRTPGNLSITGTLPVWPRRPAQR
jgi:hypothetical protein